MSTSGDCSSPSLSSRFLNPGAVCWTTLPIACAATANAEWRSASGTCECKAGFVQVGQTCAVLDGRCQLR
jgi:hypothetical protein